MKNLFKDLDTKTLKWMDYRWEHCNGRCEECACGDVSYHCGYIHDQVKKELQRRGE